MSQGYICVAGLQLVPSGEGYQLHRPITHVRPVARSRISVVQLRQQRGPFEVGAVVSLGGLSSVGRAPEVEDWLFRSAEHKRVVSPEAFWGALQRASKPTLAEIFGSDLWLMESSAVVPVESGSASLGVLNPHERVRLALNNEGRLRLRFLEGGHLLSLSVTDIRFYKHNSGDWTLNMEKVDEVSRRIHSGEKLLLSVGLTRAFRKSSEDPAYHWLQVNNLHLKDAPIW